MDGNKDEAIKCVNIAKEAIASGNKARALKFIGIAQRLNQNLSVDDLLAACKDLDSANPSPSNGRNRVESKPVNSKQVEGNGEANYTEEHVQLVRKIKRNTDYYEVLGIEKSCSVEEVKKAYRKLSLKVHPDKNKAPGSEEAFKKVSKAFKCLSDEGSRRQYDHTGLGEEDVYSQQYDNVRRRRRRTGNNMFEDDFDADEIFRSFFGQGEMYRTSQAYRTRSAATSGQPREDASAGTGPNMMLLLQLLPFLVIILLACLPFSEPEYSLQRNYTYQFSKTTQEYGVEFYVKSSDFDHKYPVGTPTRDDVEKNVIRDYKIMLRRYCHVEMQRRSWSRNVPTPHCDMLESLGVA